MDMLPQELQPSENNISLTSNTGSTLTMSPASRNILAGLAIFAAVISISIYSFHHMVQLKQMEGMAEEYWYLGYNLATTGSFSGDNLPPAIFRPPAYSFFLGAVIKLQMVIAEMAGDGVIGKEIYRSIYAAQALLLALSASAIYIWMTSRIHWSIAAAMALAFGCNPYQQLLVGFLHYETLHTFLIICGSLSLSLCFSPSPKKKYVHVLCGVIWGIATLTRPMTLILPPFVLMGHLLCSTRTRKEVVTSTLLFTLGMALLISPYTARNYSLTKSFIPVNAQSGIALWANTLKPLPRSPNEYRWWRVWYPAGEDVYERITGEKGYKTEVYMSHILRFEDEFKSLAWENFARQPSVYFGNMVRNVITFCVDINSVLISIFVDLQKTNHVPIKRIIEPGTGHAVRPEAQIFEFQVLLLTICSIIALFAGKIRRESFLVAPLVVFACFAVAHAVSYMDLLYYYAKMPFLILFSAYFIQVILPWQPFRGHLASFFRPAMLLTGTILSLTVILVVVVMVL